MALERFPSVVAVCASVLWAGMTIELRGDPQARTTAEAKAVQTQKRPVRERQSLGAPEIALSVNALQEGIGLEGRAVLIEASIHAPREEGERVNVVLSKPGGFWGELVAVEVRNARGEVVAALKPRLISKGDAEATFDGDKFGWLVWVLDPADGARLAPGDYSVRARLDTEKNPGKGWKGKAWSPPARLAVKPAAATLALDEQRLVALAEVRVHSVSARHAEALAACDRFLAGQPKDGLMLEEKGDILVRMGRFEDALRAYDAALAITPAFEAGAVEEPPSNLIEKRRLAREAIKKGPTAP